MQRNFFLIFTFFCVTMLEKTCAIDIDPDSLSLNEGCKKTITLRGEYVLFESVAMILFFLLNKKAVCRVVLKKSVEESL